MLSQSRTTIHHKVIEISIKIYRRKAYKQIFTLIKWLEAFSMIPFVQIVVVYMLSSPLKCQSLRKTVINTGINGDLAEIPPSAHFQMQSSKYITPVWLHPGYRAGFCLLAGIALFNEVYEVLCLTTSAASEPKYILKFSVEMQWLVWPVFVMKFCSFHGNFPFHIEFAAK